ncbi:hypothetical protein [Paenibacillus glacialis]|uniref:Uncharacterized protein n=1 Tax=Paenibacillus glacialis TaxID=494026 RepID=A0A168HLT1_9BACL|nr:hypothetical protein [Paenibacillus glacialis]OAB38316.1 hypothetical protein PGLA_19635 [Paenibacillus glacialis]
MYAVVANVVKDNQLRVGAKVYILFCHGMAENPKVYGMARDGKRIEKYMPYKRLIKFRVQWLPEHIRDRVIWKYEDKGVAEQVAKTLELMWTNVRLFDEQGNQIREGVSASEAFNIARKIKFIDKTYRFKKDSKFKIIIKTINKKINNNDEENI